METDAVAAMFMLGVEALMELSHAGLLESELTDGAAGGLAAGRVEVEGVVVLRVGVEGVVVLGGGAAAAADASGGVEDLGLSPAEGDAAPTSSTGLFVLFLWDLLLSPPFLLPPSL